MNSTSIHTQYSRLLTRENQNLANANLSIPKRPNIVTKLSHMVAISKLNLQQDLRLKQGPTQIGQHTESRPAMQDKQD